MKTCSNHENHGLKDRMLQILRQSLLWQLWLALSAWGGRQWEGSLIVRWFTEQKQPAEGRQLFARGLKRLFGGAEGPLARLLSGSIFLRPELFALAALVLAPLLPTMVVFAFVCGGFLALVLRMATGGAGLAPSPLNGYVVLFAAIYLYATITSVTVSGSLYAGALTIFFVLAFVLLISCGIRQTQLSGMLMGMLAAGTLVSLYGFYQKLNPGSFRNVWTDTDMFSDIAFRVYSTLENPNVLGEYLLLVIPLGAAAILTVEKRWERLACLIATGAMCACMIMTYSRGCYLGILFAAAVFLVLLDKRLILAGVVALLLCPLYLPESVLGRFTSIGNLADTSTSYRVYIWLGTLAMLKDYWFSGVGPGINAFNLVYPEYAYNAVTAPHSHNLFLQLVCDTGICGLLVFLILLVAYYRMMLTAIHREQDRRARIRQIAAVSAVSGFLVQSMTDYTFYNYRVLLLFWLVLGLSVLFCRTGTQRAADAETMTDVTSEEAAE